MLIILEGPDGGGKTTLANALETQINVDYPDDKVVRLHAKKPTLHPLDEYVKPLTWYRPGKGTHVICDRWHWGEAVYPKIHNRPTSMDDVVWWYVENYLRRLGAIVALVDPPTENYQHTYAERGDAWDYELLRRTRRYFRRVLDTDTYLPAGEHSISMSPGKIINDALIGQSKAQPLNSFVTYVGPIRPHGLIFGDVRNSIDTGLEPAFMPYRDTSGYYLLSAMLERYRGRMRFVGIANACDVDDPHDLHWMLNEPARATLGVHARMRVGRGGTTAHPQYARRFYHDRRLDYADSIYDALNSRRDSSKWPFSSPGRRGAMYTPKS